jgi:sulfite reductase beta subunit-like hemoprotein
LKGHPMPEHAYVASKVLDLQLYTTMTCGENVRITTAQLRKACIDENTISDENISTSSSVT